MPTMLVEIAASRCPPARRVLLSTGCASTFATPAAQGTRGPVGRVVFFLLPGPRVAETSQTLPRRNRSTGSRAVQARPQATNAGPSGKVRGEPAPLARSRYD